jgi:hypothetical protein
MSSFSSRPRDDTLLQGVDTVGTGAMAAAAGLSGEWRDWYYPPALASTGAKRCLHLLMTPSWDNAR